LTEETVTLRLEEIEALCIAAAEAAGASPAAARSLATATAAAEAEGQPAVGLSHFLDYLGGFAAGRIDGRAIPVVTRPAPAFVAVDARGGLAHLGFDLALDPLMEAARQLGLALFLQRNAYTCGALGYFAGQLAEAGFVALAATNGPPMLAAPGARRAVYGTNPLAFAAPLGGGEILLIDQASSATAFVNLRRAAERGEPIPSGWAVDKAGEPTMDAVAAINGALLAFGGARGANVALMVEVLSAGVARANWSLDAPSFAAGRESPDVGLFVLAVDPGPLDTGFAQRLAHQVERLEGLNVHVPGRSKAARRREAARNGIAVPRPLYEHIVAARARRQSPLA
jgi:(2R)-3-sulfolactate dehydrogenase (NADP+)